MDNQSELHALLALFGPWSVCPSVCRKGKWFYYRRIDGIAWRVVQDWVTERWFLHISTN